MNKTILILLLVGYSIISFAQGPPITTGTPVMLGLEGSGIRTFGKFISKENAKIYIQPLIVPYNITPNIQFGGAVPIKFVKPNNAESSGGLSDITLFTKYG